MAEQLDQSRKAAEPLPPLNPKELIRRLGEAEIVPDADEVSDEAKDNREHAAREISLIFELHNSPAFAWFFSEFIDKPYLDARRALTGEHVPRQLIGRIQTTFTVLKKVKVGMLEREIAHRVQMDPRDEQIAILRERLSLL